jgi:hypothetical protein
MKRKTTFNTEKFLKLSQFLCDNEYTIREMNDILFAYANENAMIDLDLTIQNRTMNTFVEMASQDPNMDYQFKIFTQCFVRREYDEMSEAEEKEYWDEEQFKSDLWNIGY